MEVCFRPEADLHTKEHKLSLFTRPLQRARIGHILTEVLKAPASPIAHTCTVNAFCFSACGGAINSCTALHQPDLVSVTGETRCTWIDNLVPRMSIPALSSHDVKLLSQILHSTSRSLGCVSKLASQREMLSQLLGFHDWNGASAILPAHSHEITHVAIALLEIPSVVPKSFLSVGNDAPWRLPKKIRDYLITQSLNPIGLTVSHYSRPDPKGDVKPRYWSYLFTPSPGRCVEHKVAFAPQEPSYGNGDHTPTVMTFSNARGQDVFTVTFWSITLDPGSLEATNFTGAASIPLYNTFIESITGHTPELRQAFCLVKSRQNGFAYSIAKCDERGHELGVVEHLTHMNGAQAWAMLARHNKALGLSLLDVADITSACVDADSD